MQSGGSSVGIKAAQDGVADIGASSRELKDSEKTVKAVKVEGVDCTEATIKAKKYKIYRPFVYLTKSAPTGAVKQFIDFALSAEGQKIVAKDYITVKEADKIEGTTPAAPKTIAVKVNGKAVAFDVNPVNENGRVSVPARQILESLGAKLTWDEKTKKVTSVLGNDTVVMTLGSTKATKNGKAIGELDVPAKSINGRTMVPARFISEAFGAKRLSEMQIQ